MRIAKRHEETTRVVELAIEGVDDLDVSRSYQDPSRPPRIIRPEVAVLVYVNGNLRRIGVTGPLVVKSGRTGTRRESEWWLVQGSRPIERVIRNMSQVVRTYDIPCSRADDYIRLAPEWVQQLRGELF